ncbi:hypothetical protein V8B55DRAFT_1342066 [Mucor lusitanicus]|uniref:Uncharacterized protein n=2 Tax=Mucor circinelloides f. lusitanicus TaxID=29924 RepID=A0A162MUV8_MUCCL|nr:hypothetical protein FB192DRAFT_1459791 [Mucor lusitanicus]OAD05715.1 hypothetical protein MUCCIDRAFT_106271 [Mucor lusitanicus CBS 277.49]
MDQIKDAGYQCWIQIYGPLFWIISVLINHWKLQENNKAIINDNFSYNTIVPFAKKPVGTLKISPSPTPPRIVISPSSLQQPQKHLSNKQMPAAHKSTSKKKAVAASTAVPSKPKSSLSAPTTSTTTKRKQSSSSIFTSWKQKHPHHHHQHRPLLQHQSSRTSFLRRLSSSSSTSSGDTTRSEPSSPSILKSFSWKLKRQHSDSSLETGHPTAVASNAMNSSKQPRISLSHFKKKAVVV